MRKTDAARAGSNTIRDSISRVAPSTGPALRVRLAARAASVRARLRAAAPAVPRRPGTGRSRRTARRAALAPDELAALHAPLDDGPRVLPPLHLVASPSRSVQTRSAHLRRAGSHADPYHQQPLLPGWLPRAGGHLARACDGHHGRDRAQAGARGPLPVEQSG